MITDRTESGVKLLLVISEHDLVPHAEPGLRSRLDLLLEEKWTAAQSLGVFRYDVREGSLQYRLIPGRFRFLVQFNPDRGTHRRRPQTTTGLEMPFDDKLFNFMKANESETLFRVRIPVRMEMSCDASILVNNSPIEYCSSLLVPDPDRKLPQVLTSDSLLHALSFLAGSSCEDLRLGFNSLGAAASVNHLHWHVYRLNARLAIEEQAVSDDHVLMHWPTPGFAFDIRTLTFDALQSVVRKCMRYVTACRDLGLAYNLFATRTRDGNAIRLIVWPRKAEFGCKNDMGLVAAFCEFSGFFIAKTKESFEQLMEESCIHLLSSVATEIDAIQRHVHSLSASE